jgi:hypothetical protein
MPKKNIKDLEVIGRRGGRCRLNHFDCYPLITQKWSDYQLFKQEVFELIKRKEHLTMEGLKKTLSIKAATFLNHGLSDSLKAAFWPLDSWLAATGLRELPNRVSVAP